MRSADIHPGIKVYYVPTQREWDQHGEIPDECCYQVDGVRYRQVKNGFEHSPAGKYVRLVSCNLEPAVIRYVLPQRIRGLWEDIAPARIEHQRAAYEAVERERRRVDRLRSAVAAARKSITASELQINVDDDGRCSMALETFETLFAAWWKVQ